jgi:hypothetical protein
MMTKLTEPLWENGRLMWSTTQLESRPEADQLMKPHHTLRNMTLPIASPSNGLPRRHFDIIGTSIYVTRHRKGVRKGCRNMRAVSAPRYAHPQSPTTPSDVTQRKRHVDGAENGDEHAESRVLDTSATPGTLGVLIKQWTWRCKICLNIGLFNQQNTI